MVGLKAPAKSIWVPGFSQASLTVVWSLFGVGAWVLGSRRRNRRVWTGGAVLMGIVLLKLLTVDRGYMGNMPGIVKRISLSFYLSCMIYDRGSEHHIAPLIAKDMFLPISSHAATIVLASVTLALLVVGLIAFTRREYRDLS